MFKRHLCSRCETGKYTYEIDRHSPICPYITCHNGKKCAMYKKLKKTEQEGRWLAVRRKLKANLSEE